MKFLEKLGLVVLSIALVFVGVKFVVLPELVKAPQINQAFGNAATPPVLFTMTNGTTSISSIAVTTVFTAGSFNNYAKISNTSGNDISCYLESATAASSTLVAGAGITIGRVSSTFSGEPSVCFGYGTGCIPYVGRVNCKASATTTVGLIYN